MLCLLILEEGIAYIEENLWSSCTKDIAVFSAFAEIVRKSDNSYRY